MRAIKSQLRRVTRLLRGRGASREDAEDLVQEAMLRLHAYTKAGGQVRDEESFVMRTVLNLAIDVKRHAHTELYADEPPENMDLLDMSPALDEVLAAQERLLKMREALDRVSVRTREIFFMHRLQGFSHAEIGSRLGISRSAVEKHVASAVTVLTMERQRE
jgi:RNA polymerase sigma factor (sigma-70 family)